LATTTIEKKVMSRRNFIPQYIASEAMAILGLKNSNEEEIWNFISEKLNKESRNAILWNFEGKKFSEILTDEDKERIGKQELIITLEPGGGITYKYSKNYHRPPEFYDPYFQN